jgi:hypothetical protein
MKIVRLSSLLFAFVLAASAFTFEFPVLAGHVGQNSNSSTTATENSNAAAPSRRRGRRNRKAPAAAPAESTAPPEAQSQATETTTSAPTEQTDLSGTYAGTFDCSDAGVSGETTLTVTGNQFTLADGKTGRIVASTTRGYTGVAMQFGESIAAKGTQPATVPTIVSMRAKKAGDRLTLIPVAESGHVCSFKPAGSSRAGRARRARATIPAEPATPVSSEPVAMPAPPAEPATPATVEAGPTPPATPSTSRRRGRRGRRGSATATPKPTPAVPRD